ncbi:hypothetical protein OCH239_05505 [Roseivivax halodurans JCM 10272]|uniref:Tetratricopeptide repeat protein n=1 Tax=Roseivivax halodurans JCM 10272 TaxID=1449350 RepID=X7EG59_9RHOB|nr:hypothetical protein [Roseivivax halodurans]ETX14098.1 hypothetical protein OCH239_05505 [Roseivivax halodurans JCM 10272]
MHSALKPRFGILATSLVFACLVCASSASAQEPSDADLEALRFYIAEDNEDAIRSEIRRLQIQYPNWVVPDDLSNLQRDVPSANIDRIYQLIEQGEFAAVRDAIDATATSYPDWSPSAELLRTLALAEAQSSFDTAIENQESETAIGIARSNPALLSCERVNNAWLLAERYVALSQADTALGVYSGVARTCTDPDILVSTLEKASAVADAQELGELADAARLQAPAAADRITTVETRLRAGMGAEPRATTDGQSATIPLPDAAAPRPDDAEAQPDPLEPADTATASETAPALSLRPALRPRSLSRRVTGPPPQAALAPAPASQPASQGSAALAQARQAAERGDWRQCLALSASARSGDIVSQRGWCALNLDRPMQALTDFRTGASTATTQRTRIDSSYGAALAMLQLGMVEQAAGIAATTHLLPDQRLEIESQILDRRGVDAFNRGDFRQAIAYFDELERVTGIVRRDLALLRGYAFLNSGQRASAKAEFMRLHDQMATPATRRALSQTLDR